MAFDFVPKLYKIKILFLLTMSISTVIIARKPPGPKIKELDKTTANDISRDFSGLDYKLVLAGDKNYAMPKAFRKLNTFYYNFKPKQNEIFVVSVPNGGQLWVVEVLWILLNKLSFEKADEKSTEDKSILLEAGMFSHKKNVLELPSKRDPAHRIIRTHLPLSLIPNILHSPNKIVYVARNPKDNLEAEFSNAKKNATYGFRRELEDFYGYFERDLVLYNPYWAHLHEGHDLKNKSNILFLYIEEDKMTIVSKLAKFFGPMYDGHHLSRVVGYMADKMVIKSDNWIFNAQLNNRINKWIQKNIGKIWFPHIHLYYA